jgi:hypothetical protein
MDGSFALTMESVARLLGYLACSGCGIHGPHRAFVTVDGGSSALCARCAETEPMEYAGEQRRERQEIAHGTTVTASAATA